MPRELRPMNVASSDSGMITATIAGGAQVAEEHEQHERHQHRALEQV